jgi:thiamine biosynthesis lipoprotein
MRSPLPRIERAQPHLGTTVRIWMEGVDEGPGHALISEAFEIIAGIHRRMSFHAPDSELSRLNRLASRRPVRVHDDTRRVLAKALEIAAVSDGLFDPTTAPALVGAGLLPHPGAEAPDPDASWRDIDLLDGGSVAFRRPLWIDLGGIAKGFAVDRAMEHLLAGAPSAACVEAGGDLRLFGREPAQVHLAGPWTGGAQPVLRVRDASVASSGSQVPHGDGAQAVSPHVDTRTRTFCPTDRFVTVVASSCIEADALTKVVMAHGVASAPVLAHFQAEAFLCENSIWRRIPDENPNPNALTEPHPDAP